MQFITFIRTLFRKLGASKYPTQYSAQERHEASLAGYEVIERRREGQAYSTTVRVRPEVIEDLSIDELTATVTNANRIRGFFSLYLGLDPGPNWTLEQLDQAFEAWVKAENKGRYSTESVVAIVGAAFGSYCAEQLGMKWIHVRDADGHAIAVRGVTADVRGFPYSTVSKRIADSEFSYLRPVFNSLRESIISGKYKAPGA
jgi:hypothetical protein